MLLPSKTKTPTIPPAQDPGASPNPRVGDGNTVVAGGVQVPTVPGGMPSPPGITTESTHVGAQVPPHEGSGPGFSIEGGITGALLGAASSAASMAASGAAMGMDGGAGGAAASAAIDIGIQEMTRAIEFGAQAAGIGVQGVIDTVLPAGGSALAQENWLTRFVGGIVGAAPNLANMAGAKAQGELGQGANLPGVGPSVQQDPNRHLRSAVPGLGPSTAEGIVAKSGAKQPKQQGFAQGGAVGPSQNGVFINGPYIVKDTEDKAGQDLFNRYYAAGAR